MEKIWIIKVRKRNIIQSKIYYDISTTKKAKVDGHFSFVNDNSNIILPSQNLKIGRIFFTERISNSGKRRHSTA